MNTLTANSRRIRSTRTMLSAIKDCVAAGFTLSAVAQGIVAHAQQATHNGIVLDDAAFDRLVAVAVDADLAIYGE